MELDNIGSQMKKGLLELCILGIVMRKTEAYPSEILEQLKTAQLVVLEGTLYPLLTRLKNAGMLTYRWEESNSGPPRKYFTVTDAGRQLFNELNALWSDMAKAVNSILAI